MDLYMEMKSARELAVQAGSSIMDIYARDFEVQYKDDDSPLTEADKKANDIIVQGLTDAFPHPVLAEESADDRSRMNSKWCWIVDPLDGTKEFVKKNGEFTVNIGLVYEKRPVLGVVYLPVLRHLFYAAKGGGAFFIDEKGIEHRISTSSKTRNLILMKSRSHASDKLAKIIADNPQISETREAGSALKGCLVAKGEADLYIRFNPTKEWDTCAMHCVVEEAGGIMRQIDHSELVYNRENIVNEKGFYILNRQQRIIGLLE